MSEVRLVNVNKVYPHRVQAVYDFNLTVKDKEFVVLVGPSGCGKSTTLRMIAGLEDISSGQLYIDGVLSNDIQPKDRGIAMVFQSYALYPHMTVRDNMSFGLKMRNYSSAEINARVEDAAKILELTDYLDRKPKELSGGQRQRVALGRAIVRQTKVFLMDEPLSNLDAKLRVQMRGELIALHEKIGATTIYVTHDQTEAMTMASRIVIMKDGRIQQIGAPKEVYQHPANLFVAGFIGNPAMNFIDVVYKQGRVYFADNTSIDLREEECELLKDREGQALIMGVRPEDIVIDDAQGLEEEADVVELLGSDEVIHFRIKDVHLEARVPAKYDVKFHDKIKVHFVRHKLHFFDPITKVSLQDGALCLDSTLPSAFHGKKVACRGLLAISPTGEKKRFLAHNDDIEVSIADGVDGFKIPSEVIQAGHEVDLHEKDYQLYLSAKLVQKVLNYLKKKGADGWSITILPK
jgi:multiple sugar transport system ATP-binding protein